MIEGRFVVLTGGLAGFHPSKRQPLPGTETLWQGVRTLAESVFAMGIIYLSNQFPNLSHIINDINQLYP